MKQFSYRQKQMRVIVTIPFNRGETGQGIARQLRRNGFMPLSSFDTAATQAGSVEADAEGEGIKAKGQHRYRR